MSVLMKPALFSISAPRIQTVTDPADSTKVFSAYVGNLNHGLVTIVLSNLGGMGGRGR